MSKSKNWLNFWTGNVIGTERFIIFTSPKFYIGNVKSSSDILPFVQQVAHGGNFIIAPVFGTRYCQCVFCLPDVYEN